MPTYLHVLELTFFPHNMHFQTDTFFVRFSAVCRLGAHDVLMLSVQRKEHAPNGAHSREKKGGGIWIIVNGLHA